MSRKLTITLSDAVYDGLQKKVGRHRISRFIEDLARPHVLQDLDNAYRELASDAEREREALAWSESLIGDLQPHDSGPRDVSR